MVVDWELDEAEEFVIIEYPLKLNPAFRSCDAVVSILHMLEARKRVVVDLRTNPIPILAQATASLVQAT
jgi:hypothetical protein